MGAEPAPTPVPTLPEGMTARGASADDVDGALAVIRADEAFSIGEAWTSRADVAGDWARPSVDLATDVLLVEQGERLVGHAEHLHGRAFVHVHPDVRGQGVGSALCAWTEAHARADGQPAVGQTLSTRATAGTALLRSRGYAERWQSWVLRRDLDAPVAAPTLPDGFALRAMRRPDEDRALFDVIDTAFDDFRGGEPSMGFEDWRASYLGRDTIDPDLVLLVLADTEVVGAALCIVEDDEGWVDQLAVARAHRGRGLAGALLQEAFRRFRDRGLPVAALSTDSRTGALGLYQHVGMEVSDTFVRWSLPLV